MIDPKEYDVRNNVSIESLIKAGFKRTGTFYTYKSPLYYYDGTKIPYVSLVISIKVCDDPIMVYSIICDDGTTYPPFYNKHQRYNNLVSDKIINAYNSVMDGFAKKNILKRVR